MKTKNNFAVLTTLLMLFLGLNASIAQTKKASETTANTNAIEVIQFHSEHRCVTCNKIEALTKETLKDFKNISFSLVNVDDAKNAKKAEQFEASGTALFLYNAQTGKKKDLTDFAFMNAGNKEKFITALKKQITQFGN